jgi:predicted RecB family nuclease
MAVAGRQRSGPNAYSSQCKFCWWHTACLKTLVQADDLILLPELGRCRRDAMIGTIATVQEVCRRQYRCVHQWQQEHIWGHRRSHPCESCMSELDWLSARTPQPYLYAPLALPRSDIEVFSEVGTNPLEDFCYLHGTLKRRSTDGGTEQYHAFFEADMTLDVERPAFKAACDCLAVRPTAIIYFCSKYERTIWRAVQRKYPDI